MTSNKQNAIESAESSKNNAIAALPKVEVSGLSTEDVAEAVSRGDVNITSKQTSRSLMDIVRANVFTLFNAIIFTAMVVVLATGTPDSIDLVDEDDTGCLLLSFLEEVSYTRGTDPDEHLYEVRACEGEEGYMSLPCHSLS